LQRLLAQLNLTADQQAKIKSIEADQSLSREQRFSAIKAVLTPEQQTQLQALMQQQGGGHRGRRGGGNGSGNPGNE
jgi:Spy/CpxP family protein refolding chaperone